MKCFASPLASRRIGRVATRERKRAQKESEALKTGKIKRDHRWIDDVIRPALLSSSLLSLTPSSAASAASVAAPAPVAGLESVQGTRPESEEAQGGHSIFELEPFFQSFSFL